VLTAAQARAGEEVLAGKRESLLEIPVEEAEKPLRYRQ
jgi:hypothetical protein